jgi:hypothetical protein
MAELEKIVDNLNIPKQILDKSEALLKTLFGPSFEELGGLISDQVKLRRFKNQVTIFSKAQGFLKDKNIDPKKVSLKVLAPLIEYSSYEEEESVQNKWAKLTAHVLTENLDQIFQQNCISILNKLSSVEAKIIDDLHDELDLMRDQIYKREVDKYERMLSYMQKPIKLKTHQDISLQALQFSVSSLSARKQFATTNIEDTVSNLVALGLLKWETKVEVDATKADVDPTDDSIDVDVNVSNNDIFIFTPIGDRFVKVCNSK